MDYVPIMKIINSRARLVTESVWEDEDEPDFPNPLPVPSEEDRAQILDIIEEIEGNIIQQAYTEMFGDKFDGAKWGQISRHVRETYGQIKTVPIHKLIAIEPKLYSAHLTKLTTGFVPTRGEKFPIVYVLNSGMYLGDGNHRVVNELMNGKTSVKAYVLDFRKAEQELE